MRDYCCVYCLLHELKLAIWWDKADTMLRLKLTQLHTLMELAVIDGYRSFGSEKKC